MRTTYRKIGYASVLGLLLLMMSSTPHISGSSAVVPAVPSSSPVEVLSGDNNYFLKINLREQDATNTFNMLGNTYLQNHTTVPQQENDFQKCYWYRFARYCNILNVTTLKLTLFNETNGTAA